MQFAFIQGFKEGVHPLLYLHSITIGIRWYAKSHCRLKAKSVYSPVHQNFHSIFQAGAINYCMFVRDHFLAADIIGPSHF